jgi:hypothetical protein
VKIDVTQLAGAIPDQAPGSAGRTPAAIGGAVHAASIGQPVTRLALAGPVHLSLLSQHRHVMNLLTPAGDLVAVVDDAVGPGPFNVEVANWDGFAAALDPGQSGYLYDNRLCVGWHTISLRGAAVWNPDPNWPAIGQSPGLVVGLQQLATWYVRQGWPCAAGLDRFTAVVLQQAITQVIDPAAEKDRRQGLARLLGLGPGLTPLGDDWLAGWLLRQHLPAHHPDGGVDLPGHHSIDMITTFLVDQAAGRTTRLSQAWLRAAAAGWVDASWHQLLHALAGDGVEPIDRAAGRILRHGATSGYAMLAGFLQEKLA